MTGQAWGGPGVTREEELREERTGRKPNGVKSSAQGPETWATSTSIHSVHSPGCEPGEFTAS